MFKTRHNAAADRVVMTLPDDYLVRRCIDRWIVVGPTGLFVIGRANGDLDTDTRGAASMAHLLRTRLAEVLPWVPFVSPVVVADETRHGFSCPVVQMQDLRPVLATSGRQITDGALQLLRHHIPGVVQDIEFDRSAVSGL